MPAGPRMPRPTAFIIADAVTKGLSIPAIEIDPRFNFVRGAFIFASDIDKLSMSFKSFKAPLETARDKVVIPSIERNFDAQGRPAWKALRPNTIKNRMYEGYPRGPILQKSGRLKKAATRKNIWGIMSAVGREGADMLRLRTEFFDQLVPYAQFHQLGSFTRFGAGTARSLRGRISRSGGFSPGAVDRAGSGRPVGQAGSFGIFATRKFGGGAKRLPARPFIQLTVDEEVQVYNIFFNFMTEKVDRFWGPESRGLR